VEGEHTTEQTAEQTAGWSELHLGWQCMANLYVQLRCDILSAHPRTVICDNHMAVLGIGTFQKHYLDKRCEVLPGRSGHISERFLAVVNQFCNRMDNHLIAWAIRVIFSVENVFTGKDLNAYG
jgi:hypothetical protein